MADILGIDEELLIDANADEDLAPVFPEVTLEPIKAAESAESDPEPEPEPEPKKSTRKPSSKKSSKSSRDGPSRKLSTPVVSITEEPEPIKPSVAS